ncbi:MAG: hypothetical protein ACTSYW_00430 [Candidatus Heimdallarchaeota archaeon]
MFTNVLNYKDLQNRIKDKNAFFEIWITNKEWEYLRNDINSFKNSSILNAEEENNPDIVAKIDGILIKICENENLKYNLINSI